MLRFENVARSVARRVGKVSINVALGEPGPSAIVTAVLAVDTRLPAPSCTATVTAGAIVAPAVAELGELVKANFAGAGFATVKLVLVADVNPVAVATNV